MRGARAESPVAPRSQLGSYAWWGWSGSGRCRGGGGAGCVAAEAGEDLHEVVVGGAGIVGEEEGVGSGPGADVF